jgi:predicted amidohydrolase YtcJ
MIMDELLLYNGPIRTIDAALPSAQAVLIRGERISFVGTLIEARKRASASVHTIDLGGRTLIPGFNDNHTHLVAMGDNLSRPNLQGMDEQRIVEFLKEAFRDAKPGRTLYAWGWDYPSCPRPHRCILDEAFPNNPVVLIQFSGHGLWVNSRVLRRYRIGPRTAEPAGGKILRDDRGLPTGILRDAAAMPVHRARYWEMVLGRKAQRRILERALEELRRAGITSIQDNTWFPSTVGLLNEFRRKGLLTARVSCWFYGVMPTVAALMRLKRFDDSWVTRGLWKYFLDGTFSTRSAWLLEHYAGEPDNSGISTGVRENIDRYLELSFRRRRQAAFHAIGDRTTRELLDGVRRLQAFYPNARNRRLRIEHAQLIDPEDIPRLRDFGVLIAAQPQALGTPEKDEQLLGDERARRAYPYRSLLDAGVPLSFGSDMPAEISFDPLLGIHYTVNRSGPERITAAEALEAYTLGSAYAEFKESEKGSITAGKLADLVILSKDPLSEEPRRIRDIEVESTIVGGKIVYAKEGSWPTTSRVN